MTGLVVVGVDGSKDSERALSWAATEAGVRGCGLRIVAVHSQVQPVHWHEVVFNEVPDLELDTRVQLERSLWSLRTRQPTLRISTQLQSGQPAAALLDSARDADLLVVGSRGHGRHNGPLPGSTAHQLACRTDVPLVIVGRHDRAEQTGRVAVGVDAYAPSTAVCEFAFDHAALHRSVLRTLFAWTAHETVSWLGVEPAEHADVHRARHALLDGALAGLPEKYPQVVVEPEVTHVPAAAALVSASYHADLVIIGARRPPGYPALGPVAHSVLRLSRCPVAIIPR